MGSLVIANIKRPEEGDEITHTCAMHGKFKGVVDLILSAQFIYVTYEGQRRFCMFNGDWESTGLKDQSSPKQIVGRKSVLKKKVKGRKKRAKKTDLSLGEMDLGKMVEKQVKNMKSPRKGETVLQFLRRKREQNNVE